MSTSRRGRGHAPKDSGISMAAKPEPDLLPTPPSSQDGFFEVRDASIVFEMKWCREGNHEAPAVNFRDEGNWSCCHCADQAASYPPKPGPRPRQTVGVRPDSDSSYGGKGVAAACPDYEMKRQQHHDVSQEQQPRRQEERPQIQYYSSSYKPRGFENSSRPPKTLQTYHPHVRPPNMGNYIIKPDTSSMPLQRLNPNTETRAQPQPQPKSYAIHGSRTYHDVPKPTPQKLPSRAQPMSVSGNPHEPPRATVLDDILKTILVPPPPPSEVVSAQSTTKANPKAKAHHYHRKPQVQETQPQQTRQQHQKHLSVPQTPKTKQYPGPSLQSNTQTRSHQKPPQQQKRPRPKTQYDKPPASSSWELKLRKSQELKRKKILQQPGYEHVQHRLLQPQASAEEQARADSEVLGPQETCPACRKHYPSYSELIEAYGLCYGCLRRHLVAVGELLQCPSCCQLHSRDDFKKHNYDGLVVKERTKECRYCQWEHRPAAKLKSAVMCGADERRRRA
ncbi:hypothetical protein PG999_006262 [Apiospora kogelbergensis]|uniref:Uncharacterized protein n=1 Tax=Apiospora kogelbergensis TaxID=1337665 RepID=A0AAW0QQT8_9PEZI